jgi:hypothetical protein
VEPESQHPQANMVYHGDPEERGPVDSDMSGKPKTRREGGASWRVARRQAEKVQKLLTKLVYLGVPDSEKRGRELSTQTCLGSPKQSLREVQVDINDSAEMMPSSSG